MMNYRKKQSAVLSDGSLNGDPLSNDQVFTRIYKRFQKPIANYVRAKVANPEVAAEITQEVFLKAYRFRGDYRADFALSTWLWTIARNTISDQWRSRRLEPIAPDDRAAHLDEIPSGDSDAESLLIRRDGREDGRRRFRHALSSLTRLQRRVINLRIVRELSYREIAQRLGMSLSAVKNLAYRARQALESMPGLAHGG